MENVGSILNRIGIGMPPRVNPEHTMLVFGDERYTYAQMNEKVNRMAYSLAKIGVKKGERAGILLWNCTEWVVLYFAIAKLGAIVVPINFMLKPSEIEFVVNDSWCNYIIVDRDLTQLVNPIKCHLKQVKEYIVVHGEMDGYLEFDSLIREGKPIEPQVDVKREDIFTIQYTSGTTGHPKGATHTHGGIILGNLFPQICDFEITSRDVFLCVASFCWVTAFQHLTLSIWIAGGTVIIMPSVGLKADEILQVIEKERPTSVTLLPIILRRVLDSPNVAKFDISSLNRITSGAEPLSTSLRQKLSILFPRTHLIFCYGISEGPTVAAFLDKEYELSKMGSVGKPTTGNLIRLLNESEEEVEIGSIGEICIRGPAVMKEYWNSPEETSKTLRGGWLHTGDLGRLDKDGFLYIVGRKKDMIISGALKIYPAEIEEVICKDPRVAEAAVIGISDEKWGEVGKAIVVLKPEEKMTTEEMIKLCADNLANYKVPKYFKFTYEPLPKTSSGKVRKFELRDKNG
jgi:fatty-acyl-CoA synthase